MEVLTTVFLVSGENLVRVLGSHMAEARVWLRNSDHKSITSPEIPAVCVPSCSAC